MSSRLITAMLLALAVAGCAPVVLPEGFTGATGRDTGGPKGADLWLVHKGRALKAACADTTADGRYDIVLREEAGGISLEIHEAMDGLPAYEGHMQPTTTDDFRRYGPGMMVDPSAPRPEHTSLLEYEAHLSRNRSLQMVNTNNWVEASLDDDGDLFRELVVSKENGMFLRVDYYQKGDSEPCVWLGYEDGKPSMLGWRHGKAVVLWDPRRDMFSVDADGDRKVERLISAENPPEADDEMYSMIIESFTEITGRLIGTR